MHNATDGEFVENKVSRPNSNKLIKKKHRLELTIKLIKNPAIYTGNRDSCFPSHSREKIKPQIF